MGVDCWYWWLRKNPFKLPSNEIWCSLNFTIGLAHTKNTHIQLLKPSSRSHQKRKHSSQSAGSNIWLDPIKHSFQPACGKKISAPPLWEFSYGKKFRSAVRRWKMSRKDKERVAAAAAIAASGRRRRREPDWCCLREPSFVRKVCPPSWRLVYKRLRQRYEQALVIIPDEMMVVLIPSQVTQTST